jgi:hypothetical protein
MAALKHMLLQSLGIVAVAYAVVVLLMWLTQDRLVYFPQIAGSVTMTPASLRLPYEDLRIATDDGEKLAAWWIPAADAKGAVLVLHGNAGSIADRLDYVQPFHAMAYSVLLVDYRGYGASTGKPTEAGTYADAQAAWRSLTEQRGLQPAQIVVLGESLGGAVAAELAARVQPRALLLVAAFTSATDLGSEIYPWLPVRLISRFHYDTLQHLRRYRGPVLIAHSHDDEIVPYAHGERLHAAASGEKTLLEMRGGHNDAFLFGRPEWTQAVAAFLGRLAVTGENK